MNRSPVSPTPKNRYSETTSLGTVEVLYDPSNRLTRVAGVAYQWDPNGNTVSNGTGIYTYDVINCLTSVAQRGWADYHLQL